MLCIMSDFHRTLLVGSWSGALAMTPYRAEDNPIRSLTCALGMYLLWTKQEAGRLVP
jgi:hypothetical protein